VIDGTKKREICDWWLRYIEVKADTFLSVEYGYSHLSVPDDYMDRPPEDIAVVEKNYRILDTLIKEEPSELQIFMEQTVRKVYSVLDPLLSDIHILLSSQCPDITAEHRKILQSDADYLSEMKKMDEANLVEMRNGRREIRKLEMSAVVPVCGLIMARYHILSCELKTTLDIWGAHLSLPPPSAGTLVLAIGGERDL
jgi:hypothetical protein